MKSIETLAVECTDYANHGFLEAKTAISVLLERWEAEIREDERLKTGPFESRFDNFKKSVADFGKSVDEFEKSVLESGTWRICPVCKGQYPNHFIGCPTVDKGGNVREESEKTMGKCCPICKKFWPSDLEWCPDCHDKESGNVREESEKTVSETCPCCERYWPDQDKTDYCPHCGIEVLI